MWTTILLGTQQQGTGPGRPALSREPQILEGQSQACPAPSSRGTEEEDGLGTPFLQVWLPLVTGSGCLGRLSWVLHHFLSAQGLPELLGALPGAECGWQAAAGGRVQVQPASCYLEKRGLQCPEGRALS